MSGSAKKPSTTTLTRALCSVRRETRTHLMKTYFAGIVSLLTLMCSSLMAAAPEPPTNGMRLAALLADFRLQFLDHKRISDLTDRGEIQIDGSGLIRGETRQVSASQELSGILKRYYAERPYRILTGQYLVIVRKNQITRLTFRKIEELPERLELSPGDLLLLYQGS
jgi:hypothetical protein